MSGQSSTVTSAFIDLATFDEFEKYSYGGNESTAYFCRETRKSSWFTQVPVVLAKASGQSNFGNEWSVTISRAGDYLLDTWLRVQLPEVKFSVLTSAVTSVSFALGWTPNFMHNLIRECCITFNDLVAARFDNFHLDFWAAFTVPSGKAAAYNQMIGNHADLLMNGSGTLPSRALNLPLPFFYSRDSGVALPTAALPYNDMRINFSFRRLDELLQVYEQESITGSTKYVCVGVDGGAIVDKTVGRSNLVLLNELLHVNDICNLTLTNAQVWANYTIVSNDERKRMSCAPRDILIEQVQTTPLYDFIPKKDGSSNYDIRFSHSVKVIFFGIANVSCAAQRSNYSTGLFVGTSSGGVLSSYGLTCVPQTVVDPMTAASLLYENTYRLSNMTSDYYSLINPYYHAPVVPAQGAPYAVVGTTPTGYHSYSYSLDFICLDPMGSTNFGKLTNVSMVVNHSDSAVTSAAGTGAWIVGDVNRKQKYRFILTCVNNNIIRISGGALGFPVL